MIAKYFLENPCKITRKGTRIKWIPGKYTFII